MRVTPSATSERLSGLLGSSPIPLSLVVYYVRLQLRPLPSTGITRLHRYYRPLRHPKRPGLSLASCQLIQPQSPLGLPVLPSVPFAYMPSPLPRQVEGSCSLILFPLIGLPQVRGGSAPASWISRLAQRSLTLRPARLQSRLYDPLPPEASAASLPLPLLRLLPGGTNQLPGGTCTR
ncbi:hypothetical protein ACPOL_3093 [Acidisarcina polymorpha]|uniref:Uncharacterized protein n=1 Tax=Acidisarcina polymorpha TaxID=2211140 RepID=A0A2Z5FZU1_9BACT|nr:hypothetical protein ACPOL_3093 [Acidisarcina polymorpha]